MFNTKYLFGKNTVLSLFSILKSSNNIKLKTSKTNFSTFTPRTTNFLFKTNIFQRNGFDTPIRNLSLTNVKLISITPLLKKVSAKKRVQRKKWNENETEVSSEGRFNVLAFATADEYKLESLVAGLVKQDLYEPKSFFSTDNATIEPDVLYVKAKYKVEEEPREIFFFREGTVVLWNISELESSNVLSFLKKYEKDTYNENLVQGESELMPYSYHADENEPSVTEGQFYLSNLAANQENFLEKYTFSNALSASVKLGIWEASLDKYVESMDYVTDDLKKGKKIKISRHEMLQKTGELFELKHFINLSSDLLDTPDFYWDREQLEKLYSQTCAYFSISRRTRVMNEKLNHCVELAELISSNLNDKHHIRLEWMIIILIMVEVVFEFAHYIERYYGKVDNQLNRHPKVLEQFVI